MNELDTLKGARELLSDESRWTQNQFARRADGSATTTTSSWATCWCLVGALERESGPYHRVLNNAICLLKDEIVDSPNCLLAAFNDTHTHAEVLALLDRTIAKVEASC